MNILEHSNTLGYKETLCNAVNLIQKIPHRHTQMFVSEVMVDSVKSTVNITQQRVCGHICLSLYRHWKNTLTIWELKHVHKREDKDSVTSFYHCQPMAIQLHLMCLYIEKEVNSKYFYVKSFSYFTSVCIRAH